MGREYGSYPRGVQLHTTRTVWAGLAQSLIQEVDPGLEEAPFHSRLRDCLAMVGLNCALNDSRRGNLFPFHPPFFSLEERVGFLESEADHHHHHRTIKPV